ncbi:MAG: protein translocase subunit SecD [Acidobacteriaceae bacterium]|nr:protein translocase subunit SecD [Acidobacteriaceae bacterium]
MSKNLTGRTVFILAILVIFIYGIVGIPTNGLKQSIMNRIHLGLDLKGGTHLVLQVHVDEAINSAADRDAQRLTTDMQAAKITGVTAARSTDPSADGKGKIVITGITPDNLSAARDIFSGTAYGDYDSTTSADGSVILTKKPSAVSSLASRTLETSIETIRDRVDVLGVAEPTIQRFGLGENQILVELPGVTDLTDIEDKIKSTSKLEVHAVTGDQGGYDSEESAMQAHNGLIPPDSMLVKGSASAESPDRVWMLRRVSVVEGMDFRGAERRVDQYGRPNISFTLTTEAGKRFYDFTSKHSATSADPGSMAIVLNNKVRSVATIQSAIRDQGEITGHFTKEDADALSLMLRTGALPASITFLETRTVGPSLGLASIRQGVRAAIVGLLAVMVFMLIYYRGSGFNAVLALILNLIILLGFMGFVGSTLTLPGIAGVILTIGMGVDSNVLIFERIREELRAGKSAAMAVEQGFKHAFVTIIDTHVTTIVAAAILFQFGTGPVKGFAVTLVFGLLANLFTAVFVSRVIFDAHLRGKSRDAALSI